MQFAEKISAFYSRYYYIYNEIIMQFYSARANSQVFFFQLFFH